MTGFTFKLEQADGASADPPQYRTAVPTWQPGDTIPIRPAGRIASSRPGLDEGTDGDPVSVLVVVDA